jgi:hypothetical protein
MHGQQNIKFYIWLFMVFFKEDIINVDLCRQIIQRLVNNKLETMWNEAEGSKIRNDTDADMEIQRRSMRKLSRNTQSSVPQEYEARVLTVPLQYLVKDDRKHTFVKQKIISPATKRSIR